MSLCDSSNKALLIGRASEADACIAAKCAKNCWSRDTAASEEFNLHLIRDRVIQYSVGGCEWGWCYTGVEVLMEVGLPRTFLGKSESSSYIHRVYLTQYRGFGRRIVP